MTGSNYVVPRARGSVCLLAAPCGRTRLRPRDSERTSENREKWRQMWGERFQPRSGDLRRKTSKIRGDSCSDSRVNPAQRPRKAESGKPQQRMFAVLLLVGQKGFEHLISRPMRMVPVCITASCVLESATLLRFDISRLSSLPRR